MLRHSPRFYAFGPYRLDPGEKVLLNEDQAIPLTPKALETLLILVSRHGHLVGKDELIRSVWPDTVVEENNLNQNISALRRVLGDGVDGRRFIETVPRRGYRFVAEVAEVPDPSRAGESGIAEPQTHLQPTREAPSEETQVVETPTGAERSVVGPSESSGPVPRRRRPLFRGLIVVLAVGLVGALIPLLQRTAREPDVDLFARPRIERLTDIGRATAVAISPQGDYIAYALGEPGQQELWVKHLATASTTLIVARDAVLYWSITFSPDGHYVYYVVWRHNEASGSLYRVPLLGGTPQLLIQESGTSVSFSPDGRRFAFTVGYAEGGFRRDSRLMIAEADGAAPRPLVTRTEPYRFSEGGGPAWSPDGTLIACGATFPEMRGGKQRLVAVSVADAEQRTLSERGWTAIGRAVWLRDGSGLLLTAKEDYFSSWRIWHVAYPSGIARIVVDDPNEYKSLTLPTDGSGFVAVQIGIASGIWVWPAERPNLARRISSEVGEYGFTEGLSWTPDGKLLCRSRASGNWDVWMMNGDGSGSRQVTFDPHTDFHPSVLADGRSLAFVSNRAGRLNIWRMWLDGSDVQRLTDGDDEVRPQGSPDGRWVVYQKAFGDGRPTIWRVPVEGGRSVQLSKRHALRPVVSPDGRSIGYFSLDEQKWSIEVIPMEGGEPIARFDIPPTVRSRALHWTPDGRALAYVDDQDGPSNLWRLPMDGGPRRRLTAFGSDHIPFFAWSQDGKWVAAVRENETSDVVRVTFAPY